jgi:hypothetical protein
MRFVGFDFRDLALPFDIRYTPEGWDTTLTASVLRSPAQARTRLLRSDGPVIKQLTPILLRSNFGAQMPVLSGEQVITSLVSAASDAGAGATKTTSAGQLPEVLSHRARVLSYREMENVAICAGFMIVTFQYDFADAPAQQPGQTPDYEKIKQASAQDALVGTAYNLARRKTGHGAKEPMVHNTSKKNNENLDQVHTEQLLCGQLDAFLGRLKENARAADVVNVHERWQFKKEVEQHGFDFRKLTVKAKFVFEHVDKNVVKECDGCAKTIEKTTAKWGPACKGFSIAVTKNS